MINCRSVVRGMLAMRRNRGQVNVAVKAGRTGFWIEAWTPVWHEGRGPYVSIGLGVAAIYRGY